MGDNRPPVYIEDDEPPGLGTPTLIIRASAIGHPCLWELIAAGQGEVMMPVPRVLQRAFDEGNALEPMVVQMMENLGFTFLSHQSEGELWLSDDVAIRYHSDGIGLTTSSFIKKISIVIPQTTVVVEIKALSDALWKIAQRGSVGDVIPEYKEQLSSMMIGEGLPGLWVAYNKGLPPDDDGKRPPCDDEGKLLFEYVAEPPVSEMELRLKASLIKEGVYGEPIISSDKECNSPDHWPCRYLNIRPEHDVELVQRKVLVPDDPKEFDRLAVEYLSYKGQYDEAKQRYEHARNRLVELAGDASFIQTDKFFIPIVSGTSVSTNTKAMSQELRDAIEKYKVRKPTRFVRGIKRMGF